METSNFGCMEGLETFNVETTLEMIGNIDRSNFDVKSEKNDWINVKCNVVGKGRYKTPKFCMSRELE